jgi:glutamyl-tRNA synthetase
MNKDIRVRIAPSPTGKLHIGTARTALFNLLFARKRQGSFILRVEDTDKERSKKEFEESIIGGLEWLGLTPNEMPGKGNFGPYRQSERTSLYKKYLEKLLEEDKAYYCFCSKEELEKEREEQRKKGKAPCYSGKCSQLSREEVKKFKKEGKESVIRIRNNGSKIKFNDLVRGEIEFDISQMGDFIIAKNSEEPLYNFACVIDDNEMKISHVIRGEDHIANTPRQILLQNILKFNHPQYGHLPLILGPDKKKMSKRHGATSVLEYKKDGYLPKALINFMAFLGWNPGTEKEIYSLKNLIKDFSIKKVQKSGAVFNIEKLNSINSHYIRQKPIDELADLCIPYLIQDNFIKKNGDKFEIVSTEEKIDKKKLENIISLYQKRLEKLSEISDLIDFFFQELNYKKELLKWKDLNIEETNTSLYESKEILSNISKDNFNKEYLTKILLKESKEFGNKLDREGDRGCLLWPLRVALTGKENSAGPFEIASILGKEKTIKRINQALEK